MIAAAGFQVERSPDLVPECRGQSIGAEVKHFRFKPQDETADARPSEPGEYLVEYGALSRSKGSPLGRRWRMPRSTRRRDCGDTAPACW